MLEVQDKINDLKESYLRADKEYQFAFASHDNDRLVLAIKKRRTAWSAYNKAKKAQFDANFVSSINVKTAA